MNFKILNENIKYKNPFYKERDLYKEFIRRNPKVLTIINKTKFLQKNIIGQIIEVSHLQYDYLINGNLITQRAGKSIELLKLLMEEQDIKAKDWEKLNKLQKKLQKK